MRRRIDASAAIFWGLLLIVAGGGLILTHLGIIPATFQELWPAGVILVGLWWIAVATRARRGRGLTAGLVIVGMGGFLLARQIWGVAEELFIAVLLLAIGLGVMLRSLFFRTR
jgi:hypothetical protein